MDVYGAIFSQSVQSRTKNRLFFVKRVDTRNPLTRKRDCIFENAWRIPRANFDAGIDSATDCTPMPEYVHV